MIDIKNGRELTGGRKKQWRFQEKKCTFIFANGTEIEKRNKVKRERERIWMGKKWNRENNREKKMENRNKIKRNINENRMKVVSKCNNGNQKTWTNKKEREQIIRKWKKERNKRWKKKRC